MEVPTIFSPVIIPTLCRYEHFRNCIESLAKCTWAEKTDVYVGLDYPAKESHWEGYIKIKEYLSEIQRISPFKSLTIIKRDHNFGIGPNGNSSNLREYVLSKHDSFIFSEDDNIFSPAFLDYMNKGLEKIKDDPTVFAICGYRHFYDLKFENNTFYRQNVDFSAWGYGIWGYQWKQSHEILKLSYLLRNLFNPNSLIRLYRNGLNRLSKFFSLIMHNKGLSLTDNILSVYICLKNIDVIMPTISLVRNMGWDGSGENCKDIGISNDFFQQEISLEKRFDFLGTGIEYYHENKRIHKTESYGNFTIKQLIRNLLSKI